MGGPGLTDHIAIDELAESFVTRFRAGERPSVDEYADRYPQLADKLRELLPTLALLEQRATPNSRAAGVPSRAQFTIPNEIGEFTIVREIGRGGMGIVYEAIQQSLGRHVALKVLGAPGQHNLAQEKRFCLESRAAARLQHAHIVPVYGVGEQNGLRYYAMQFIQGRSLDLVIDELRRLRRVEASRETAQCAGDDLTAGDAKPLLTSFQRAHPPSGELLSRISANAPRTETLEPMPPIGGPDFGFERDKREFFRYVARAGLQVAEALAYAHSEGILHRDIKPSNLLLDAKRNLWITDFGLAKDESGDQLTQTGDFVGTLRYMAPERFDGWSDRRSDIYSLGATLYEFATLQLFLSGSQGKLVEQVLHRVPTPPTKVDASTPRDFETIILKATDKEPANRYRTADEMAEDLRRFLADLPILSRRAAHVEQLVRWCRRNPTVALLTSAVAALLCIAVVILSVSNARIRNESAALAVAVRDKDAALTTAHEAVDQMLTRVASKTFADMPKSHPLRVALLEDALKFYKGLASQEGAPPKLRQDMANVLITMAGLQRELGRFDDAAQSLRQSIDLLTPLVANDPDPPSIRERLANAELDLAYTLYWGRDHTEIVAPAVEQQYRKALGRFDELEHEWPDRRQPAVLCLRILADAAYQRGDRSEAQHLLQTAIDRGEAYVAQHPDSTVVRTEIAWTSAKQWDQLEHISKSQSEEGERILNAGLRQVDAILEQNAGSTQASDVSAALHFRLALQFFNEDRIDDSLPQLDQAISRIENLCTDFPYNTDYWNSVKWFNSESMRRLRTAGHEAEARKRAESYLQWLKKIAAKAEEKPQSKAKLEECQTALMVSLRLLKMDRDADQAAQIVPSPDNYQNLTR